MVRACRVTIPRLSALQRKYKTRGLVVLGLTTSRPGDGPYAPPEELASSDSSSAHRAAYGFAVATTRQRAELRRLVVPDRVLVDRRAARLISVGASDEAARLLERPSEKLLDEQAASAAVAR